MEEEEDQHERRRKKKELEEARAAAMRMKRLQSPDSQMIVRTSHLPINIELGQTEDFRRKVVRALDAPQSNYTGYVHELD